MLTSIVLLIATSCGTNKAEQERKNFEKALQRLAITWMQNNMDLSEASFYKPGATEIVDTLWIFPTRYDDPVIANLELKIEKIQRELFGKDIQFDYELQDIERRADSVKRIRDRYLNENKENAGWILRHEYRIGDSADVIHLGVDNGLNRIYGETPSPELSRRLIQQNSTTEQSTTHG